MQAGETTTDAPAAANDTVCWHCGTANPPRARWRAPIDGTERQFCCAGCMAVAQTIEAAGLDAYYARRTSSAPRADASAAEEVAGAAAAAAAGGLVRRRPDGRCETSLLVDGMTCGACVWLIEQRLAARPGVVEAAVNYATRRARVAWDPERGALADVLGAIASIGYRAYPYDPARREALARREGRALLTRMAVALLAMMQVMMFAVPTYISIDGVAPEAQRLLEWASLTLTLPVMLYCATPFYAGARRDLARRRPGMDVPVVLGLVAAFLASVVATWRGEGAVYYDSVTMFVALLLVARYVEQVARQKAGAAIETVARALPATAERLVDWPRQEAIETVPAGALAEGDLVLVRPGATLPADGAVVDGRALVEEAVLTGEARPQARGPGDAVLAGSVNREGALVVRVDAAGDATQLAGVLRLTERAAAARPRLARLADRVASIFVIGLLALAAATALAWIAVDPARALPVTFSLLVVSCPCALSLATPAALAASAGALVRRQIVLARPDALEALAQVTHVVLDKTGTLTDGRFRLVDVLPVGAITRDFVLAQAAALEARSEHPVALAIRAAATAAPAAEDVTIVAGQGIDGVVAGRRWRIGRPAFVAALAAGDAAGPPPPVAFPPTATLVALGDAQGVHAWLACADAPRTDAAALVAALRDLAIVPVVLSGDRGPAVAALAAALGIADARGDLSPADKRAAVAALQAQGAVVAMVGDGVNDAPALAQAHVSVSLASGTPLAQWTADVVILSPLLMPLAAAFAHARRSLAVVRQNLGWAIVYNAVAIPAAAFGFVTPLVAAIGMSASSLAVVLNALRLARVRGDAVPPPGRAAAPAAAGGTA